MKKLTPYWRLMRLDKPIGSLLLLWPTLWALWLAAGGMPPIGILVIFILGVVIMRSAGCVINDWADYAFDGHVQRTKQRPLASGQLSRSQALWVFAGLIIIAVGLVCLLNRFTIQLAMLAALLAIIYPFTKRYLPIPQFVLGLAFSCSILMAFSAIQNQLPLTAWWLFVINLLWTIAYDTEYAMVDREDDKKIKLRSSAIYFGRYDRLLIAVLQAICLVLLVGLGFTQLLHWPFYLSLLVVCALFGYQQYLIRQRQTANCFKAFLNNQWVGLLIFLGILLG